MSRHLSLLLIFVGIMIFVLVAPLTLYAQGSYGDDSIPAPTSSGCQGAGGFVPLECFQGSRKLADAYSATELGPFIQKLFVGAISFGAILAVLRLAWAGFTYMASDLPGVKSSSKEIIGDVLLGLFLLLGIYLILYQINPDMLNLKIKISPPASQNYNPGSTGGTAI